MPAPIVYAVVTLASLAVKLSKTGKSSPRKGKESQEKAEDACDRSSVKPCPGGKNGNGKNDNKLKGSLNKSTVKCFCVDDHAKGGRAEYERQLKDQQTGLNQISANDYLAKRKGYSGKDVCGGYKALPEGKTIKRDPKVTSIARKERLDDQTEKHENEFLNKGLEPEKAELFGEAKAKRELAGQAATHTPDLTAGGDDVISMISNKGFGEGLVNSHIGSQWNGPRIQAIDQDACKAKRLGHGDDKMNVALRACGKKEAVKAGCNNRKKRK